MTYEEAKKTLKRVMKACIELGLDADTILELYRVCSIALDNQIELEEYECIDCEYMQCTNAKCVYSGRLE